MKAKAVEILVVLAVFLSTFMLKDLSLSVDKVYATCPMDHATTADCPDEVGSKPVAPEPAAVSAEGAEVEKLVKEYDRARRNYETKKASLDKLRKESKTDARKRQLYIHMRDYLKKNTQGLIDQIDAILAKNESDPSTVEEYKPGLEKAKALLQKDLDGIATIEIRIDELTPEITIEEGDTLVESIDAVNKRHVDLCADDKTSDSDAKVTEASHDHDGDTEEVSTEDQEKLEKAKERAARRYFLDRSWQELVELLEKDYGDDIYDPDLGKRDRESAKDIRNTLKNFGKVAAAEYFVEQQTNPDIRKSATYYDTEKQKSHMKEEVRRVQREIRAKEKELKAAENQDLKEKLNKELFALQLQEKAYLNLGDAFDHVGKTVASAPAEKPKGRPYYDYPVPTFLPGPDGRPQGGKMDPMIMAQLMGGNLTEQDMQVFNQIFGIQPAPQGQSSDPRLQVGGGVRTNPWGGYDVSFNYGNKHRGFEIGGSFDNNYWKNGIMGSILGMPTPGYNPMRDGFIDGPSGSFGGPFNPGTNAYADPRGWFRQ